MTQPSEPFGATNSRSEKLLRGDPGAFSFTATSFTVLPGLPGAVQMQVNFQGDCDGFGFTLGTMNLSRHGPSFGRWSCCAATFPERADGLTGTAQGSVSGLAPKRWRTQGLATLSDGREFRVDGELDLGSQAWCGQLLPRN